MCLPEAARGETVFPDLRLRNGLVGMTRLKTGRSNGINGVRPALQ